MILLSTVSDFHELAGAHAQYTSPQKPLHSSLIRPSGLIRLDTLQSVQLPAAGSRTLAPGHAPHHHHQLGCANGEADNLLAPSCTGRGLSRASWSRSASARTRQSSGLAVLSSFLSPEGRLSPKSRGAHLLLCGCEGSSTAARTAQMRLEPKTREVGAVLLIVHRGRE